MSLVHLEKASISKIPVWFTCLICSAFVISQTHADMELVPVLSFTLSTCLSILTFNILGGLKTVNGWLFATASISTVLSPLALSLLSGTPITADADPGREYFGIHLIGTVAVFLAAYAMMLFPKDKPGTNPPLEFETEKFVTTRSTLAIVAFVILWQLKPINSVAFFFVPLLVPIAYFFVFQATDKKLLSRSLMFVCFGLLTCVSWYGSALSGMKSSIIYPLTTLALVAILQKIKVRLSIVVLFAALLFGGSIIAYALQPLRDLKQVTATRDRVAIAAALFAADMNVRYGINLQLMQNPPPHLQTLISRIMQAKKEVTSKEKLGILNRFSLMADDSKLIAAVSQRGYIPIPKFFEEMIIIPRFISGMTFRTDKLSAFYGRYGGVIGRKNFTTGIAYSGPTTAYAHGGYFLAFAFTLISGLCFFLVNRLCFGDSSSNFLAQLWILRNVYETSISIHSQYQLVTRDLPIFLASILIIRFLFKICFSSKDLRRTSIESTDFGDIDTIKASQRKELSRPALLG